MLFEKKKFTPAMAAVLLENTLKSGFNQRPLSKVIVSRYAHDMKEGKFYSDQTGETLKIAKLKGKDILIDGQHRLAALINANISLTFLVVDGLDAKMFQFIDGGKPRTLSDLMVISGSPLAARASVYAVTGYMLYKEDKTKDPRKKPDAEETDGTGVMLSFIQEEYAEHITAIYEKFGDKLRAAQKNNMGAQSLWLYFMTRMMARDTTLAAKFLNYVANYGAVEPCSKNLLWAARLMENMRKDHSDPDGTVKKARYKDFVDGVIDAWVLAWNLTREGTHLKSQGAFTAKFVAQHKGEYPGIK